MSIIEVNHLTKKYQLGQLHSLTLGLKRLSAGLSGRPVPERPQLNALDDIDFKVQQGEVLGIIGSNGAGKSTLLKILSSITVPSHGNVKVQGKVAPLIEVGAGLIGDLTGRENIYLNGAILGMSKKEIARKFDEIVEFSELEEFLETPVKRYSSGMTVRLGFSIATSVEADILIVDEVLAVGDLAFQRKCFDRMEDMIKRQQKTVLLVSHNIRQVERLCTRTILLDHGKVVADGAASDICNLFYGLSDAKIKSDAEVMNKEGQPQETTGQIDLINVQMMDSSGNPCSEIQSNDDVTVCIRYQVREYLHKPMFFVGVHTTDFFYVATESTEEVLRLPEISPGAYEVRCKINRFPFLPGVYALRVAVGAGAISSIVLSAENAFLFQILPSKGKSRLRIHEGVVAFDCSWFIENLREKYLPSYSVENPVFIS